MHRRIAQRIELAILASLLPARLAKFTISESAQGSLSRLRSVEASEMATEPDIQHFR